MEYFVHQYKMPKEVMDVLETAKHIRDLSRKGMPLFIGIGKEPLRGGGRALAKALLEKKVQAIVTSNKIFTEELYRCYLGPLAEPLAHQSAETHIIGTSHAFRKDFLSTLDTSKPIQEQKYQYTNEGSWLLAAWSIQAPVLVDADTDYKTVWLGEKLKGSSQDFVIPFDACELLQTLFIDTLLGD